MSHRMHLTLGLVLVLAGCKATPPGNLERAVASVVKRRVTVGGASDSESARLDGRQRAPRAADVLLVLRRVPRPRRSEHGRTVRGGDVAASAAADGARGPAVHGRPAPLGDRESPLALRDACGARPAERRGDLRRSCCTSATSRPPAASASPRCTRPGRAARSRTRSFIPGDRSPTSRSSTTTTRRARPIMSPPAVRRDRPYARGRRGQLSACWIGFPVGERPPSLWKSK